tara:strand:- start:2330 stop:2725 length:396 start_codon:yes stop_codon:yes gene_type:complete
MTITNLHAEQLILTTLLDGNQERALGMAAFACVFTDDDSAECYVTRIKDEALDRLIASSPDFNLELHDDDVLSVEELMADVPPEVAVVLDAIAPQPPLPPVLDVAAVMAAPASVAVQNTAPVTTPTEELLF